MLGPRTKTHALAEEAGTPLQCNGHTNSVGALNHLMQGGFYVPNQGSHDLAKGRRKYLRGAV